MTQSALISWNLIPTFPSTSNFLYISIYCYSLQLVCSSLERALSYKSLISLSLVLRRKHIFLLRVAVGSKQCTSIYSNFFLLRSLLLTYTLRLFSSYQYPQLSYSNACCYSSILQPIYLIFSFYFSICSFIYAVLGDSYANRFLFGGAYE